MIKLPLIELGTFLSKVSISSTALSGDTIGSFLGLVLTKDTRLLLIDLIRCNLLSDYTVPKEQEHYYIKYFDINTILITCESEGDYYIATKELFHSLTHSLIPGKTHYEKSYIIYIHTLLSFYELYINICNSPDKVGLLVYLSDQFWDEVSSMTTHIRKVIKDLEGNYIIND